MCVKELTGDKKHARTGGGMKQYVANAGGFYFLNFAFNPRNRTLQRGDVVLQLRKKQSDVLALLCTKYPEPVSHTEFLTEVWGGSYVTSQSIAQMIRSLRVNLEDNTKSIIVTIPKLGYQLTVEPCWKEFGIEADIQSIPVRDDSMSVISHAPSRTARNRKMFSLQSLFLKAVAKLF